MSDGTLPVRISKDRHERLQQISKEADMPMRALYDRAVDLLLDYYDKTGDVPKRPETTKSE